MRVSLVVPCYREEAALDAGIGTLLAIAADEIVFVDDGSDDGTADRLASASKRDARVRVATHARNRGVGAAMRTGFSMATGDVVVAYDADRTYPPEDVPRLVAAVAGGADAATATPFAAGGGLEHVPAARRALSRAASLAYRLVMGRRGRGISTYTCGFRAYRAAALAGVAFRADGFPAAAEILGLLLLRGARVVEVGSRLSTRAEGRSKMRALRAAFGHLRVLLRLADARMSRVTSP